MEICYPVVKVIVLANRAKIASKPIVRTNNDSAIVDDEKRH
jgi:hypothetical protein